MRRPRVRRFQQYTTQQCEQCDNVKYVREAETLTVQVEPGMRDGQVTFLVDFHEIRRRSCKPVHRRTLAAHSSSWAFLVERLLLPQLPVILPY